MASPPGLPEEATAPPRNRMAIAVLALLGCFVSLYLLAFSLGWLGEVICGIGDCATVQTSEYAWVGPIPVSAIGLAGYVALLAVALAGVQPGRRSSRFVALLLLGGSAAGVAFSAWLTYIEAAVLEAWCQWCVVSAILISAIFLLSLPEIRRMGGDA